jgi:hypothetical protein
VRGQVAVLTWQMVFTKALHHRIGNMAYALRLAAMALICLLAMVQTASSQLAKKSKDVDYSADKFTGTQFWETELFGRSALDGSGVGMTVRKAIVPVTDAVADTSYLLIAHREEPDWAFFRGPSQWLIDGERVTVGRERDATETNRNDVVTRPSLGVRVLETAIYRDVTPSFLERLANAKEAELRLPGERDNFTRKFDKKPKERLRRFLNAVLTPGERR